VLVIGLAGRALTKLADFAFLGIVNKILGGVFGLLKIGLIASVALNIFVTLNDTVPFVDETDIDDSVLYEPVMAISTKLYPAIKEKVEEKKKDLLTKDEEEN
jgi:membrane protein required for colicin V production